MRRRVRFHPSKPQMILSLVVGVIFCFIGIFICIPTFGLFGIFWTLVAVGITVANAIPLFTEKRGYTAEMTIEDEGYDQGPACGPPPSNAEQRLAELQSLYSKGLISRDEYDQKRAEILDEI